MFQAQQHNYQGQPVQGQPVQGIPVQGQQLFPPAPVNTNKSSCSVTTSKIFIGISIFFGVLSFFQYLSTGDSISLFLEIISLAMYGLGAKGFFNKSSKHAKLFCYVYIAYSLISLIFFYIILSSELDSEEFKRQLQKDMYPVENKPQESYNLRRFLQQISQQSDSSQDQDNNNNQYDDLDLDRKIKQYEEQQQQLEESEEDEDYDDGESYVIELTEEQKQHIQTILLISVIANAIIRGLFFLLYWTGYKQLLQWEKELEDFNLRNRDYQMQLQNNQNFQQPAQPYINQNQHQQFQHGQYQNFQDEQNQSQDQGMQ